LSGIYLLFFSFKKPKEVNYKLEVIKGILTVATIGCFMLFGCVESIIHDFRDDKKKKQRNRMIA